MPPRPKPALPSRAGLVKGTPEYLEAKREYDRQWRAANQETVRKARVRWAAENPEYFKQHHRVQRKGKQYHTQVKKALIVQAMGGACYRCGEDRLWLLELDHRDPTLKDSGRFWDKPLTYKVWAEIWGCDLLCANCHRFRHHPHTETAADVLGPVDKARLERLQFTACTPQTAPSTTGTST